MTATVASYTALQPSRSVVLLWPICAPFLLVSWHAWIALSTTKLSFGVYSCNNRSKAADLLRRRVWRSSAAVSIISVQEPNFPLAEHESYCPTRLSQVGIACCIVVVVARLVTSSLELALWSKIGFGSWCFFHASVLCPLAVAAWRRVARNAGDSSPFHGSLAISSTLVASSMLVAAGIIRHWRPIVQLGVDGILCAAVHSLYAARCAANRRSLFRVVHSGSFLVLAGWGLRDGFAAIWSDNVGASEDQWITARMWIVLSHQMLLCLRSMKRDLCAIVRRYRS